MLDATRALIDKLYLFIRKVRITRRLLGIVFALLLIGLVATIAQGSSVLQQLDYLQYLESERLPMERYVQEATLQIASSQVALVDYVAGRSPDPQMVDDHISEAKNALTRAKLQTTDEQQRRQLETLLEQAERYSLSVSTLQHAKLASDEAQVLRYGEETQRLGDGLRAEAQRVIQESVEQAETDMSSTVHTLRQRAMVGLTLYLIAFVVLAMATYLIARSVIRPIREIQQATQRMGRGEWEQPLSEAATDELGDLARSFNEMALAIQRAQAEQEAWSQQLEEKVHLRTRELGQMVEQQEQLLETIRVISVPVVPILERIIVLPLVGVVDSQRATQVVESLLQGIESHQAQIALVDITGVPVVDTHVAGTLLQAAQAVRLLGCQMVLVGIRPEVAQALVNLGVDLSEIATYSDLQSGVEYALRVGGRRTLHQIDRATNPTASKETAE